MRVPLRTLVFYLTFLSPFISAYWFKNDQSFEGEKPKILKKSRAGRKFDYYKRSENLRAESIDLSSDNQIVGKYLDGDMIANGILQFTRQQDALQKEILPNLQATTVGETDPDAKLNDLVVKLQNKLQDQILGTIDLELAANSSTAYSVSTSPHMTNCALLNSISDELMYSPFYKSDVNLHKACWTGGCKLDSSRKRDLSGTASCNAMVLDNTFTDGARSNLENRNEGGAWQYFGSESGGFSVFPAHLQTTESADSYDPRLRDWYVNALVPTPLDVVVVMDKSGSMAINNRMEHTKLAVKEIIRMLRPTDRIALTAFSSDVDTYTVTGIECQRTKLSFATNDAKTSLTAWTETVESGGLTYYSRGLNNAQSFFTQADSTVDEANRKKVLVFISDGIPTDSYSTIMTAQKNFMAAVPGAVIMAYGLDMTTTTLQAMANHDYSFGGVSDPADINDPTIFPTGGFAELSYDNIKDTLGRFYSHESIRSPASNGNYQTRITMPYVDSMGMGLMVTASKAVYDDSTPPILQGVVGYDITMNYLLDFFDIRDDSNPGTYAFLLNGEDGNVLYHPEMPSLDASLTNLDPVKYTSVEPFTNNQDIVSEMLANPADSSTYEVPEMKRYKLVHKENGLVFNQQTTYYSSVPSDFDDQHQAKFNMKCKRVTFDKSETSYIMCAVTETTTWTEGASMTIDTRFDTSAYGSYDAMNDAFNYHNFTGQYGNWEGYGDDRKLTSLAGDFQMCSHGYRNSFKDSEGLPRAVMKWSPRQFTHPLDYKLNDVVSDVDNGLIFDGSASPARNPNELKASVQIMSQLDAIWREQDSYFLNLGEDELMPQEYDLDNLEAIASSTDSQSFESAAEKPLPVGIWRYFGAADGSFRIIPGIEIADNYDPTMRPWYKLAMTNPDQTLITAPYADAFGMGYVVTICRAVRYAKGSESVYGVLATDYFLSQIGRLFLDNLDICKFKSYQKYPGCIMVDSTGAVIYWGEFLSDPKKVQYPHVDVHGNTHMAPLFLDQFVITEGLESAYGDSLANGLTAGHTHECFNMVAKHSVNFINLDESMLLKEMLYKDAPCAAFGSESSDRTHICKLFNFNAYIIQTDSLNGFELYDRSSQVYTGTQLNYDFCKNTMGELYTHAEQNNVPVCQKANPNVDSYGMLGEFNVPKKETLIDLGSVAPGFEKENHKYSLEYNSFEDINVRSKDQCYAYMAIMDDVTLYEDKPVPSSYQTHGGSSGEWPWYYYVLFFLAFLGGKKGSSGGS